MKKLQSDSLTKLTRLLKPFANGIVMPSEHRPILIIVAGPNGSRKTTITSKILRHEWLENARMGNENPEIIFGSKSFGSYPPE